MLEALIDIEVAALLVAWFRKRRITNEKKITGLLKYIGKWKKNV